jgi:molecular chaperone GrpE
VSDATTQDTQPEDVIEQARTEEEAHHTDNVEERLTEEKTLDVEAEIAALKAEVEKNLDGWQRARAEFMNYKKRVEREMQESYQRATLDTIKAILPVIDDFERALENIPEEFKEHPWINGITLIQRKFEKLLEDNQIDIINPVGEPFDPTRHEAISMDETDEVESGHVTATLQKGYACGERILRAALVRVAT